MISKFLDESSHRECNACRSKIEVKQIKFGLHQYQSVSVALCKACRSLLHKRLREEDKNGNIG